MNVQAGAAAVSGIAVYDVQQQRAITKGKS